MVTLVIWGVLMLIVLLLYVTAATSKEEHIKTTSRHEYPQNRTWPPTPGSTSAPH